MYHLCTVISLFPFLIVQNFSRVARHCGKQMSFLSTVLRLDHFEREPMAAPNCGHENRPVSARRTMYFGLFFFFSSFCMRRPIFCHLVSSAQPFLWSVQEEGGGPLKPNGTLLTPKCSYICGPFEEKRRTGGRRCRESFRRGQRGLPNSFRYVSLSAIYTVAGATFFQTY